MKMKIALIRLVVLFILLFNQALIMLGWNPIPYSEEQIYEGVTWIATVIVTLWLYWKNNNITYAAQQSQERLDQMKALKDGV
jgi:SPP1 family holin